MTRTYFGWTIERYRSNDGVCFWRADKDGRLVRADTLAGLRSLIRDTERRA